MLLVFPSGEVEIDFLARSFRNTTPFALDPNFAETPVGRDPLGAALGAFVRSARGEADAQPQEAEEGARAVGLALLVAGHSENFGESKDLFRLRGKTVYERV